MTARRSVAAEVRDIYDALVTGRYDDLRTLSLGSETVSALLEEVLKLVDRMRYMEDLERKAWKRVSERDDAIEGFVRAF